MRPLKRIVIGGLWLMLLSLPLTAYAEGSFIDSEVEVDVTSTDSASAREEAMAKGQTEALSDLLGKFTTGDQAQLIITNLDPKQISAMVRGTEVLNEKMSATRYRATLKISFDANELSKLIDSNGGDGKALKQAPTGAFLIIPSFEQGPTTLLWDEGNIWRTAWKTTGISSIAGDIIVPYGDKADAAVIDVKTLSSANFSSLQPLIVRYGVTDVVLLHARFLSGTDTVLEVTVHRINRLQNEIHQATYRADPQETRETLMARASHDIVDSLEHSKIEEVKTVQAVFEGDHASVMVLVSISTLSSWTQLRNKLQTLPMIDKIEPLAISPQQVDVMIHYRGPADSLANAITAQNIRLIRTPNYWTISRE